MNPLILTKNIPVNSTVQTPKTTEKIVETPAPDLQTIQKELEVQTSQPAQNQTKYVDSRNTKPQKTERKITTSSPEPEISQIELLEKILEQVEQETLQPPQTEQQNTTQPQTQKPKNTNFKNPYMTEQEEIIAWNKWRSNLQNQIMRDSQIDYAPLGTLFLFTFVVDKFGNISNIKVECSNPNYMDVARNNVKPAIANLQKKPILNFPKGTQRTSTVVTGLFLIGTQERYSTPNDFSDYERVTY